ncbi:F0F1 ATP synthase subunit A [Candidatus Uhrbacteria bacterium]|nr:F0F1 ATP synthase subunit A [Candidatus Uhrbacteria bacterium]
MISVAAEPLFSLGGFPVTNAIVNAWIVVLLFTFLGFVIRSRASLVPKGFLNFMDWAVEFLLQEMEKVTGDRARARRFAPICLSLFLLVLVSNWMGLLPGVGSIGVHPTHGGEDVLIPLFRAATSDLNFTLAIAAFSIVATHVFGILALGPVAHVSKFVKIRGIVQALKHGPMDVMVAVVEFFVGLLEIISEFAKTLSLALRLFGNVFAGEVLLTVIYSLVSLVVPLPFLFLELLVGIIQATVFAMLVLVFLKSMTEGHAGEDHAPAVGAAAH